MATWPQRGRAQHLLELQALGPIEGPDENAVGVLAFVSLKSLRRDPCVLERASDVVALALDLDQHGDIAGIDSVCDPLGDLAKSTQT